jgi:hypothetical protein
MRCQSVTIGPPGLRGPAAKAPREPARKRPVTRR